MLRCCGTVLYAKTQADIRFNHTTMGANVDEERKTELQRMIAPNDGKGRSWKAGNDAQTLTSPKPESVPRSAKRWERGSSDHARKQERDSDALMPPRGSRT